MGDPGAKWLGARESEVRLLDQTISMQAALRDWYSAIGTAMVAVVLVMSVVGIAFAFAGGDTHVTVLGVTALRTTWLGWLAVATFSLTLIELVLDPRGAGRRRSEAVRELAALKADYRAAEASGPGDEESQRLSERYRDVTGRMPEIPNVLFNTLKAAHLRKVEVSRMLSARPGLSVRRARKELKKRVQSDAAPVEPKG